MTLFNKKGQMFSVDLMLASIALLFILTSVTIYSNSTANRIYFLDQDFEMRQAGQQAANGLLLTTGNPANWDKLSGLEDINSIGLVYSANMIDNKKMEQLSSLTSSNYEDVKTILGIAKFDFKIEVKSMLDGFEVESFGTSPESESIIVSINRVAFYDGNNVIVRLKVFK